MLFEKLKRKSKFRVQEKTIKGFIDGFSDGYLRGWLYDEAGSDVEFDLYVDSVKKLTARSNSYRKDLENIGKKGNIAFSISVSEIDIDFSQKEKVNIEIVPNKEAKINANFSVTKSEYQYHSSLSLSGADVEVKKNAILKSGLWDEEFYRLEYLKNSPESIDALAHYILIGGSRGYNPNNAFSTNYYLTHYDDVKEAEINALYHYIISGEKENRRPCEYFSPNEYLEANPDLKDYDGNLLAHYIKHGKFEGRRLKKQEIIKSPIIKDGQYLTSFELAEYYFKEEKELKSSGKRKNKVIAYYLPQFHPFEQNNKWWGKGFTEWHNVAKAKSLLENHKQPRLPSELGYYDLRLKETIKDQAILAKNIGVDSFCLYYYWFNGTVLMDTPLETIYQNKDIDTEYCLCWANENWTRAWDGMDKEILIEQTYSENDDIKFIKKLSKYFKDKRYTKVNGKPLLIIYRPSLFPDMKATIQSWKKWCKENKIGDIHVAMVQFDETDPNKYGFDAAVEFPPHCVASENVAQHMWFNSKFSGSVHDYNGMVSKSLNKVDNGYTCYKAVTMEWDNTARRNERASFFVNTTPGRLGRWLNGIDNIYDRKDVKDDDRLVFINAWNEWAEGTYLEPDVKHGYAYANAVSRFNSKKTSNPEIAVLAHIFYDDLVEEIISYMKNIPYDFDILITCVQESYQGVSKRVNEAFPDKLVDISVVPNHGRDIGPWLLNHNKSYFRYKYICKLHSKKSLHAGGINNWRGYLYDRLLGSEEQVETIINQFKENEKLGMIYPEYSPEIKPFIEWGSNKDICQKFMKNIDGSECPDDLPDFPAGSMFWFRPESLKNLLQREWGLGDFPEEAGQIDATIMHAVERCLVLILNNNGYEYKKATC